MEFRGHYFIGQYQAFLAYNPEGSLYDFLRYYDKKLIILHSSLILFNDIITNIADGKSWELSEHTYNIYQEIIDEENKCLKNEYMNARKLALSKIYNMLEMHLERS